MAEQHLIGVLSDTHIPHRLKQMPQRVYDLLKSEGLADRLVLVDMGMQL